MCRTWIKTGKTSTKEVWDLTSPSPEQGPQSLLELAQSHWHIENQVHDIRNFTYDEDRYRTSVSLGATQSRQSEQDSHRHRVLLLLPEAGAGCFDGYIQTCAEVPGTGHSYHNNLRIVQMVCHNVIGSLGNLV